MSGKATLSLQDISIQRGGKMLIADLTLAINGPKLLWVVGGNGIGKTSLLRSCAGLSRPFNGSVNWIINDIPITAPEAVAFLPSDSYAKSGLSAAEEAKFWNTDLQATKLAVHSGTRTEKLSTGQTKRLSLAKLMSSNKPIWILDEPLAGLDMAGREIVAQALRNHVIGGGLALVASHAPIAVGDIPTQRLSLS